MINKALILAIRTSDKKNLEIAKLRKLQIQQSKQSRADKKARRREAKGKMAKKEVNFWWNKKRNPQNHDKSKQAGKIGTPTQVLSVKHDDLDAEYRHIIRGDFT